MLNNCIYKWNQLKPAVIGFLVILLGILPAQENKVRWQRSTETVHFLQLFHSIQAFHLPTAETMQKGDVQFELAHRFTMPVSSGWSGAYGLDGSVIMHIGLDYALSNKILLSIARRNLEGNVEFLAK